jgi:hypothetical protein
MQYYSRIMRGPVCCKGLCADAAGLGNIQRHFLLGLMETIVALLGQRCLGILHGPFLCLGILHGPDPGLGILHELCWASCSGCSGRGVRAFFLGRPSLVFLEQGFGWWLRIFGLTLIGSVKGGSNFVARRRLPCSRRQSLIADD